RGLIEVGNLLDVVYYYKTSRSVQTLTEASYHTKTMNLRFDVEKMATTMASLELISQLLHEHEVNHPLFDFTQVFLKWLNKTSVKPAKVFPYLQIRLAALMGLNLQLQLPESKASSPMYLNIDSGLVCAGSHSSQSYRLTARQYKYIALTLQARNAAVFSIAF